MELKLFVDTMIFLHFRPLEELNLNDLTAADSVTLVVPKVTLHELDKHKSSHPLKKIRDRSRRILIEIEKALRDNTDLKGGIGVEYFGIHPKEQIDRLSLNPLWSDDVLVASIVAYREKTGHNDVALLSQDTGPRLTCFDLGISTFQLEEELALPEELSDVEKENRDLHLELARVKQLRPTLDLVFAHQKEPTAFARFPLPAPAQLDEEDLDRKLNEIREKYPKHSTNEGERRIASIAALASLSNTVSPQQWAEYNEKLEEFYGKMEAHFREFHKLEGLRALTIPLTVAVRNTGTAPADDVDVLLHFPDGPKLLSEDDLPEDTEPPSSPRKPRTQLEELTMGTVFRPDLSSYMHRTVMPSFERLSSFKIRKTNSYDVSDHFNRVKHGGSVTLPKVYVEFPSFDEARSFHFTYEIRPANAPEPFKGELHLIVDKDRPPKNTL